MVKVKKRDGRTVEFAVSKIAAGVRRAGATAIEAAQVAKEVSARVSYKIEISAEELSNMVVIALKKVNETAAEAFVKHRDAKLEFKEEKPETKILDKTAISRILRTVQSHEGFHFYKGVGDPTGTIAVSLSDFVEKVRAVDISSVSFHFKRQDFEKWIREVIGDVELSTNIDKIRRENYGEELRKVIFRIVNGRLDEIRKM